MVVKGQCNCGNIKVDVDLDELPKSYICYCLNCQRSTGSAFSVNLVVKKDVLTIHGTPKPYEDSNTISGRTIHRLFCGDCGSPVLSDPDPADKTGIVFLKGALFYSPSQPQGEAFHQNKPHWMGDFPCLKNPESLV